MSDDSLQIAIENEAGRFPVQMTMIGDVFAFSFKEAAEISTTFSCNADLFALFDRVSQFLRDSDLSPDDIDTLTALFQEEAEVINFSQKSRSSVIAI